MKNKLLKRVIYTVVPLLLIVLASIGTVAFFQAARAGEATARLNKKLPEQVNLGEKINLFLALDLPWGQDLQETIYNPAEGFIPCGEASSSSSSSFNLKHRQKIILIPIKSYPGSITLKIARPFYEDGPRSTTLKVELPDINIEALKIADRNALPLADEMQMPPPEKKGYYLGAAAIIIILLLALFYLYRRRLRNRVAPVLKPWEIALQELDELHNEAVSGNKPLVWCVARLSDIIRDYLSSRFNWPVTTQTTEEFFASLKRRHLPLNQSQIHYLEDFMSAADLIKFANIKPSCEDLENAMERARELIAETAEHHNMDNTGNNADIQLDPSQIQEVKK